MKSLVHSHEAPAQSKINKLLLFSCKVVSDPFVTPWTVAHQVPLSMGFSKQEFWSGLPFPSPGDLADPEIKPHLPHWQVGSLPLNHRGSPKNK